MFEIKQNSIIPMLSIEYNDNMVGFFQDEQKFYSLGIKGIGHDQRWGIGSL